MAISEEFGTVYASTGDFGDKEQVFLIRGADPHALDLVAHYMGLMMRDGMPGPDLGLIRDTYTAIADWQAENPDLMAAELRERNARKDWPETVAGDPG